MFKNIFFYLVCLILVTTNIYAKTVKTNIQQPNPEKLQILASTIETKENIIIATGNVLVHSPEYYITAQKVIYDKNSSTLELFDNVNIIKNGESIMFSEYSFLDFSKEVDVFTPVLQINNTNNIWINSKIVNKESDFSTFDSSTLSSCDCYDPAWSISFTSGDFNSTQQWLNTYNTTLFINELPIFYTPYFGFPTDTTRRTGLLRPTIGLSKTEGFLYSQPIFYAPKLNWDMEYIPQIRTKRGNGHHLKFRFKDSDVSLLEIQTGIFKENSQYFSESNLRNQKHYGWDLEYKRSKLISNKNSTQDGLLVSLHGLNDIDYINTQIGYNDDDTSTDKLIKSEVKYFYNTNTLYGDIDLKYYKDASKLNNDNTMHELPKVHLHQYSTETFIDNLLYSSDVKYSNKTRTTGLTAQTTNIFVPLTYSHKLLDDYLNIAYSEQLTLIDIRYGNNTSNFQDGQFLENKHIISISTDLLKPYKNYIHTVNFKTSFTVPNIIKQDGDLYSITSTVSDLNIAPVTKTQKNIAFSFNQSLYDKEDLSHLINHKINQSIIYSDNGTSKLSDLENNLILYYKYGQLSNRLLFNHQEHMIINSSSSLSFNKDDFTSNIYYSYSKDTSGVTSSAQSYSYKDLPGAEALTIDLSYKFNKYYMVKYKEEYDLVTEVSKKKEYTLDINKKCWALNVKLADNLVAAATTNNSAIRQKIFYIEVTLKPILTINQEYIHKKKEE